MPTIPTSSRIIQYIAAKMAVLETMQSTLETYQTATNIKPAAAVLLDDAYELIEGVQAKLSLAIAAQAAD